MKECSAKASLNMNDLLSSQFSHTNPDLRDTDPPLWKGDSDKVQILRFLKSHCSGQTNMQVNMQVAELTHQLSFPGSLKCNLRLVVAYPAWRTSTENKGSILIPSDIWAAKYSCYSSLLLVFGSVLDCLGRPGINSLVMPANFPIIKVACAVPM